MRYPRLLIYPNRIEKNVKTIVDLCDKRGIEVAGVTKGVCAHESVVKAFINGGVKYLADSRIKNLKSLEKYKLPKIMLRLPMKSEAKDVVEFSDISLNSEYDTMKELSKIAIEENKIHNVILMIDLGDLREGYFLEKEFYDEFEKILDLKGVKIVGIGTNLTCYGGVIPDKIILEKLIEYKNNIETKYNLNMKIISGGNSSSINLVEKDIPEGINNLRIGEALLLGRETAYGNQIDGTYSDGFILEAEIIEIKMKPSAPVGKTGIDAFGNIPEYIDRGIRRRIICGIGRQDIKTDSIISENKDLIIIGGSSDHLIIDSSDSKTNYKIGDILKFNLNYGGILSAMTSEYIEKINII